MRFTVQKVVLLVTEVLGLVAVGVFLYQKWPGIPLGQILHVGAALWMVIAAASAFSNVLRNVKNPSPERERLQDAIFWQAIALTVVLAVYTQFQRFDLLPEFPDREVVLAMLAGYLTAFLLVPAWVYGRRRKGKTRR